MYTQTIKEIEELQEIRKKLIGRLNLESDTKTIRDIFDDILTIKEAIKEKLNYLATL